MKSVLTLNSQLTSQRNSLGIISESGGGTSSTWEDKNREWYRPQTKSLQDRERVDTCGATSADCGAPCLSVYDGAGKERAGCTAEEQPHTELQTRGPGGAQLSSSSLHIPQNNAPQTNIP